ncbi:predicted protein [Nematostella vectensis]|uniref:Uncharacterized protein n=1 Tax=Nematostella vectensis TaxID=45351 RepID=A7RUP7_NEMVE|nr:mannose-1-phosphate guanyltransferase alpha-A [Nematostella vectensis]EDO44783.1 predicted protein [Nematostella vectensis]|eukprot:XP_001636846.1 predicted protein [Nematostella vectensis]
MFKVVILIGGPMKGTRFRPLSLELPKPLFPVAGFPIIHHHIEACKKIPDLKEVILIGFYQSSEPLSKFITSAQQEFGLQIRYLQEYQPLGTVGGIYHFRDQISFGNPDGLVVINADISCDFPFQELLEFHQQHPGKHTIMTTEANRKQAYNYGCLVEKEGSHEVVHYVEKPETFVSSLINCGVYIFSLTVFQTLSELMQHTYNIARDDHVGFVGPEVLRMGEDLLTHLAGTGELFAYKTDRFWTTIKSAGSAIYANRNFLNLYQQSHPKRLATNAHGKPMIIGDVYVHPSAVVDTSAVLGPNVSVGSGVVIGPGARIRESIVLDGAELKDHCCILYSIIGWNCTVGQWARIEGHRCDPNPNDQFARPDGESLFGTNGKLTPSITILGRNVSIPAEVVVLNSIVLPHKELSQSYKNEIIL